jgi:hypothetical protein
MPEWASSLGLTRIDVIVLFGAPVAGMIGSVVRAAMIRQSLEAIPDRPADANLFSPWFFYARFTWYVAWMVVGLGSGLLIAMLFIGGFADTIGSAARIVAVALLAGYGAPSLWKRQEEALNSVVSARMAIIQASATPRAPAPTSARAEDAAGAGSKSSS